MTVLLIPLIMFGLISLTSSARRGQRNIQREIPNALEMFSQFSHVVAISDWNKDALSECLTGKQIFFDPEAKKATYLFMFKDHNGADKRYVAYHISQGPVINEILYLDNDVQLEYKGILHYTDYTTCKVIQGHYHRDREMKLCAGWIKPCCCAITMIRAAECMLFVSKEAADNVTQDCIEQYKDICGAGFHMYARDLCPDDEEKY